MKMIGIEIGTHLIKILEVSKRRNHICVQRFTVVETPIGSVEDGIIKESEALQTAIETALREGGYKTKKVVLVIQSSQMLVRPIWLPKYPEKAIRQLLEIDIEQYLPIKRHTHQIDFRIIEEREDKLKIEVVAVPNPIIFSLSELITQLKCKPIRMIPAYMGLWYLVQQEPYRLQIHSQSCMFIDWGWKHTTVTMITATGEVMSRVILFGTGNLKNKEDEIACAMQKEGADMMDKPWQWIGPQIEYHILTEIEKMIAFFYSYYEAEPIQHIYLIGGGAHIETLRTYVRDALNKPTEVINQLFDISVAPSIMFEQQIALFMNNLSVLCSVK